MVLHGGREALVKTIAPVTVKPVRCCVRREVLLHACIEILTSTLVLSSSDGYLVSISPLNCQGCMKHVDMRIHCIEKQCRNRISWSSPFPTREKTGLAHVNPKIAETCSSSFLYTQANSCTYFITTLCSTITTLLFHSIDSLFCDKTVIRAM